MTFEWSARQAELLANSQESSRRQAQTWTAQQAQRLGVAPEDILRAIARGWLSSEIASLPSARAGDLAGKPPYRSPEAWNP